MQVQLFRNVLLSTTTVEKATLALTTEPLLDQEKSQKAKIAFDFLLFETEKAKKHIYDVRTHTPVRIDNSIRLKHKSGRIVATILFEDDQSTTEWLSKIRFARTIAEPIDKSLLKSLKKGEIKGKQTEKIEKQTPPPLPERNQARKKIDISDVIKVGEEEVLEETTVIAEAIPVSGNDSESIPVNTEDKIEDDSAVSKAEPSTIVVTAEQPENLPVSAPKPKTWLEALCCWSCNPATMELDDFPEPVAVINQAEELERQHIAEEIKETFKEIEQHSAEIVPAKIDQKGTVLFSDKLWAKSGFLLPMSEKDVSIHDSNALRWGANTMAISQHTTCTRSANTQLYLLDIVDGKQTVRLGAKTAEARDKLAHVIENCVNMIKSERAIESFVDQHTE